MMAKTGGGCYYDLSGVIEGPQVRLLGCRYDFSGVPRSGSGAALQRTYSGIDERSERRSERSERGPQGVGGSVAHAPF